MDRVTFGLNLGHESCLDFDSIIAGPVAHVLNEARVEEQLVDEVHVVDGAALHRAQLASESAQHPGHPVEEGGLPRA